MGIGFRRLILSLRASAHTGVAIRPPEALNISEIVPGRWEKRIATPTRRAGSVRRDPCLSVTSVTGSQ